MAKVLVTVKLYPEDVETDRNQIVEELKKRLPQDYELVRTREEPVAFGYVALKAYIAIPEETEGGTERLEEILRQVPHIQDFEIEGVHRLSEF